MSLAVYNKKRDFKNTKEPPGTKDGDNKFRFVIQRHLASRLHYDFRLELSGVLKSWAVPKGPSLNPSQKRLAMQVEDHPVGYINFRGTIPKGNYGAGKVEIWDRGRFKPVNEKHQEISERQALLQLKKGELKFSLQGKKLRGEFVLVRLKNGDKNWLLIKHKDRYAVNVVYNAEDEAAGGAKSTKRVAGVRPAKKDMKDNNKKEEVRIGKDRVIITNRDKVFWPDEGYTKGDVVDYYDQMSSFILPHLKGRPISLKRNPNGIRDEGFYHKDAGENAPSYVTVFPVANASNKNKIIDYVVSNNRATLLYLANLGCIEINPWNSTQKTPDKPTWMVIDIDPSPENEFTGVVDVALMIKNILDKAGVSCYCKTSGSSGLHVYIPLKNKYDYKEVREFARIIATLVQEQLPETTTLERSLSKRGPKIYIDYLQNSGGQTLASVYSIRPVPGAFVSTPLDWKEVNHQLHPSLFTIRTIIKRVEQKGDLFKPVLIGVTNIGKALANLGR